MENLRAARPQLSGGGSGAGSRASSRFARTLGLLALFCGACSSQDAGQADGGGSGGSGNGGSPGTGGSVGSGGSPGSGGSALGGSGGTGTGGSIGTGGTATGGTGVTGSGGVSGSGGTGRGGSGTGTGGSGTGTGGSSSGTGGSSSGTGGGGGNTGGPAVDASLLAKCSGSNPIACHFGGNPGNYDVTVVLGGASATTTSVMAEISREMIGPVVTAANQPAHYVTTVNVRHPEGQPVADSGSSASGLDLYFWGANGSKPLLNGIGYTAAASPIVVYLASDSTGCDQTDTAYAGWGQWLPQYFNTPISIANYSNSGIDSGTFANSAAYWPTVQKIITSKDFLLIELGDNDKTDTASAITTAFTTLVTGAKAKGATPILMTPVNRAIFTGNNVNAYITNSTGANVPTIMKQVAADQNVTLLDLTTRTTTWLQGLGPNGWHPYFAYDSSTSTYDYTHLNQTGASIVAGFIRDLIRDANIPVLSTYLR